MTKIRRLRHWKQRFDKDAAFIWRQARMFNGVMTVPGELVPDEVLKDRNKLKRLWEASCIELAEFTDMSNSLIGERRVVSYVPKNVDELVSKSEDGKKWLVKGLDDTFRTKKAATEAAQAIVDKEAADAAAAEKAEADRLEAEQAERDKLAAEQQEKLEAEQQEKLEGEQTEGEPKGEIDPLDA